MLRRSSTSSGVPAARGEPHHTYMYIHIVYIFGALSLDYIVLARRRMALQAHKPIQFTVLAPLVGVVGSLNP